MFGSEVAKFFDLAFSLLPVQVPRGGAIHPECFALVAFRLYRGSYMSRLQKECRFLNSKMPLVEVFPGSAEYHTPATFVFLLPRRPREMASNPHDHPTFDVNETRARPTTYCTTSRIDIHLSPPEQSFETYRSSEYKRTLDY